MSKHICLDCNTVFVIEEQKFFGDPVTMDGVWIDVCPQCMSDHIQKAEGLHLVALDAEDLRGLQRMCEYYTAKAVENKIHTTDITLLQHYTALIDQATSLIEKIKKAKL